MVRTWQSPPQWAELSCLRLVPQWQLGRSDSLTVPSSFEFASCGPSSLPPRQCQWPKTPQAPAAGDSDGDGARARRSPTRIPSPACPVQIGAGPDRGPVPGSAGQIGAAALRPPGSVSLRPGRGPGPGDGDEARPGWPPAVPDLIANRGPGARRRLGRPVPRRPLSGRYVPAHNCHFPRQAGPTWIFTGRWGHLKA